MDEEDIDQLAEGFGLLVIAAAYLTLLALPGLAILLVMWALGVV